MSALPHVMHFIRTVSIVRLKATQAYCHEEVQNYGKILSKALLKMAGGGMHPAHPLWIHPFNLHIPPWGAKWLALRITLLQ